MKGFPFPSGWTQKYERQRAWVFELSSFFERVWRKNEMELYLPFEVLTHGFERKDSRELPSSFLKRKESKVRWEFRFVWIRGNKEGFLDVLVSLTKSKKKWGGTWWLHGRPSLGLWGLRGWHVSTCMMLWHYLCWIPIGCMCGWNFYYNISCIILN